MSWITFCAKNARFLSTHSVRSATLYYFLYINHWEISIHALRKECDGHIAYNEDREITISIHALRKECDAIHGYIRLERIKFLSTHSVRSATTHGRKYKKDWPISIHALRKECDWRTSQTLVCTHYFYPRTP